MHTCHLSISFYSGLPGVSFFLSKHICAGSVKETDFKKKKKAVVLVRTSKFRKGLFLGGSFLFSGLCFILKMNGAFTQNSSELKKTVEHQTKTQIEMCSFSIL